MSDEVQNKQNVGAFNDGKEVSSLGPPAPSDDLAECIRCQRSMPISSDEPATLVVIDGGDDWCCQNCLTPAELRAIGDDAIERAGRVQNETPDLQPRVVINEEEVEAFRKAIEFAPLKHDAREPIYVVDGDGKLLFMVDYPELVKPDSVALLETIIESRWIVQSGQCASCGVGVVDTVDALDMDDEGRLICIRCSQFDYEEWCRNHDDDDGEWLL